MLMQYLIISIPITPAAGLKTYPPKHQRRTATTSGLYEALRPNSFAPSSTNSG